MKDPSETEECGDPSIVKPGMQEYHTGHLPKPKLPVITGPADSGELPKRPEYGMITSVVQPHRAVLWVPPIRHWSLHYSRVDNYCTDLNTGEYQDTY